MDKAISQVEKRRRIILAAIRDHKIVTIKYARGKGFGKYAEEAGEAWNFDPRAIEGDYVKGYLLHLSGYETQWEDHEVSLSYVKAAFVSYF